MWIFYRIKNTFWNIYRAIKFGFQRMFRGYDNSDCWAFKWNFIERNYKLIKHFKNNCVSYPCNMTEEEWDEILGRMIKCLEMMDEDKVTEHLKQQMPDGWRPTTNSVYEIMERHKNEFFDLMKKHFYDLWW
jgi:hypothetical protein